MKRTSSPAEVGSFLPKSQGSLTARNFAKGEVRLICFFIFTVIVLAIIATANISGGEEIDIKKVRGNTHGETSFPENADSSGKYNHDISESTEAFMRYLSQEFGYVNIQILNKGYLVMTKHWICNIRHVDAKILNNTLFIATDMVAFNELKAHSPDLNVALELFGDESQLSYGQMRYFKMMLWRTNLILKLLQTGSHIFLSEADSVWLENPFEVLHIRDLLHERTLDILNMDDKPPEKGPQGGFMLLKSTANTLRVWKTVLKKQLHTLEPVLDTKGDLENIGELGNEQHIEASVFNSAEKKRRLYRRWMDPKKFISGKWYMGAKFQSPENIVILFNWVVGSETKIKRAKEHGHWYLAEDEESCLQKN